MNAIFDLRKNQSDEVAGKIKEYFGNDTKLVSLKKEIQYCIGCWSCWLKTPGECAIKDVMTEFYPYYVNSDKVILLLDTDQGFINHTAKSFLTERFPIFIPILKSWTGECHHLARYDKYPELYFYYDTCELTREEDQVIEDYLYRTAYHFQSQPYRIGFGDELSVKKLTSREPKRKTVQTESVGRMEKLIIYNGSPRRSGSNTAMILKEVGNSLENSVEIRDLKDKSSWDRWASDFENEENVLFMMPLYVHAMPAHVMAFFEKLTPSKGTVSFVVQSGFPESSQSYFLEAYFEQLSKRLRRKYLGTAIKGGVEGLQIRPAKQQKKIIKPFVSLIECVVRDGKMDSATVSGLAKPVRLSGANLVMLSVMKKTGVVNMFWDMQLKRNNSFEKRFAKPFENKD